MTTSFAYSQPHPVQAYFHNLGQATRLFGAALLAAAPQQLESRATFAPGPVKFEESAYHGQGAELLIALADEFEATQPNQASELRWLASRG